MLGSVEAPKRAIAYYRHSAEDKQENSVPIQREYAQKFADDYGIEIIHEEADEGKSGLLATRPAFDNLFQKWILNDDSPDFEYVLVYDVSRWGRFQDQDEAAYYEFLCKKQGKKVVYITKGFPKEDEQLISHLQTSIERYMAAEYSRQLSNKVFHGCVKISEQGYSAGGTACYGMTRILLDEDKKPIRELKKGEHKMIANQRVTFAPKNDETTEVVKEIFDLLVNHWRTPAEIASNLNSRNIPSAHGGRWNQDKIRRILTNETYIGTRIYNKTWNRLKQGHRSNPLSEWVFCYNAFPAIVESDLFIKAQERLYWLLPSKWKKGVYKTEKAKRTLRKELKNKLLSAGLSEDQCFEYLNELPVLASASFYLKKSTPVWCFSIPELMKKYKFVLCAVVELDKRDPISELFAIPTKEFGLGGYFVFSKKNEEYQKYRLPNEKLDERVSDFVKEIVQR